VTGAQGMFMRRDYKPVDTSWHSRGACTQEDPELFHHPYDERGAARRHRAELAKAVCRTCPVMMLCRQSALDQKERHGTWGGLSEDEREAIFAGKGAVA